MAISGDGRRVASSSLDSVIIVWDTMSGAKVATMETGPVDAWSVIFTHDDKYIVSGSHTGNVNMFNVDTGANSPVMIRETISYIGVLRQAGVQSGQQEQVHPESGGLE